MATEIKWADGNAIVADSTLRWADGDIYDYYYVAAAGGLSIPVAIAGAWKDATPQILIDGAWKNISGAKILIDGAWKDHP